MSKNHTNRDVIKFAIIGFFTGLIFPVLAWIILAANHQILFTLKGIALMHSQVPVLWLIDLVPFTTAILTVAIYNSQGNFLQSIREKLSEELDRQNKIQFFIHKLINGEFNTNYEVAGADDSLGEALVSLREELKKNREEEIKRKNEDDQRNWISEGLAKFSDILRKDNDNIETLSYNIISNLVKYLNATQGGFFIINDNNGEDKHFELTACYAYDRKKFSDKRIEWGDGLIGTCALEKETIFMTDIPDSYVNITSGLGQANPRSLLIVPLIINEEIHGVIETASFTVFEKYQIEFVEKVAESIASTISSVKINLRTALLLKESQEQAEALAYQEEQMRQNMEELQATQEEAARQSEKLASFTKSVNHTLIRAEYDKEGNLTYANQKFIDKLGYKSESQVEGKHISTFINERDKVWFDPIWQGLTEGGRYFEGDIKLVTKQGQDLWTMATYTTIKTEDSSVEKILFLAIDTTEQKKQSLSYQGQIDALNRSSLKAEFLPNGDIIGCNELFLEAMRYDESEIKETTVFTFIDKEDTDNFNQIWDRVIKGSPFQGQFKALDKNGDIKWFRCTYTAVNNMYGEVENIIFIANDVTREKLMEIETRKQTEQLKIQEEKLRLAGVELSKKLDQAKSEMKLQFKEIEKIKIRNERTLEGALDAIITINSEGIIEFYNQAAENLWGIPREKAIGKSVRMLFSEETIKNDEFVSSYVEPGENTIIGQRKEVNITTHAGNDIPVLFLLSDAMVDNEHTYTAFIQNIEVELF